MRIGVDVGGTNTDAVLMDGTSLIAQNKVPTSEDVTSGIVDALQGLLRDSPKGVTVDAVMLGTTHFTNALLEHKDLAPTGVIRLCLPATPLLPPLLDWPDELRAAIGGLTYMVHGGHEVDGREVSTLDLNEFREAVWDMRGKGAEALAICGLFSPVNTDHEKRAIEIAREEAPELKITLSHEIGRVGVMERENAAALNACLMARAESTIRGIRDALRALDLNAPLYLSQNDGTLMDAEFAVRFPVFTIASGPTNSMRGAAFLSGVSDGIVVDVGGTSTDVGALVRGFPREASVAVNIAGVRTNFRMPDVLSIALGGGSIVGDGFRSIGPESVGYRISREALIFGGSTLTATDVAVAGELANIGNRELVKGLDPGLVSQGVQEIQQRVEDTVDRVKLSASPEPIVLVGGGSILIGDDLSGASQVLRPEHYEVANAIGAAIAQVAGQVEKVYSLEQIGRQEAVASARDEAVNKAVAAGADPSTVEVVEVDEITLTYLPGNATLIRTKAVGDLTKL